jgi:hypothetical protein
MGNQVLHSWARRQQQKKAEEHSTQPGVNRKGKKLYWYTRLGKIEIGEQIFTRGRRGPEIRPFSQSAEVECRGCSEALQRAITDFGADDPFAGAAAKLREHYGIEVAVSTIRAVTEKHGAAMRARHEPGSVTPVALVKKVVSDEVQFFARNSTSRAWICGSLKKF